MANEQQAAAEALHRWTAAEDSRSPISPDGSVYYLSNPGPDAEVVTCGLEQTKSVSTGAWRKDRAQVEDPPPDVHAVYFKCPKCQGSGRIDALKKPFRVGGRKMIRRMVKDAQGNEVEKVIPISPLLTIESPVECGNLFEVRDTDAGTVQEYRCDYHVVIRAGIAYPVKAMQEIMTSAMQLALQRHQQSGQVFQQRGRQMPAPAQQRIAQDLQRAVPALQGLQALATSGQYARGGPKSIVGVWEGFDEVRIACEQMLAAMGVKP